LKINKIAILFDPNKSKVLTPLQEHHLKWIKEIMPDTVIVYAESETSLLELTDDADILITSRTEPAETFCKTAKSLKWVHNLYAGMDIIMKSATAKLDIRLTRTNVVSGPMADTTLAFIFSFLRFIPTLIRQQERKQWLKHVSAEESFNKTVGIIGLGAIGEEVARKCKLLGMRTLATKKTPSKNIWVDEVYPPSGMTEILSQSDFVVVVLPLTPDTYKIIGEKELRMMKKTAYFINISRGSVVDEEALVKILEEGVIAGAALDVFTVEPLPSDSPLWEMPNVIISPHMSADSPYYMDRAMKCFCINLQNFVNGEKMLTEVNKHTGY